MASLREVFDALVGEPHPDPGGLVRDHGFDLSEAAATDALVNYAHSAPVEVAAHLQGFVTAHSQVPGEEEVAGPPTAGDGLALLGTAPVALGHDPAELDEQQAVTGVEAGEAGGDGWDFGAGRAAPADETAGPEIGPEIGPEVGSAPVHPADASGVPIDTGGAVPPDSPADALDFGAATGFADALGDTGSDTASGLDDDAGGAAGA